MKKINTILILLAFLGLSVSNATAQDVYVGGHINTKATLWKNGTPTSYATTSGNSCIYSVVVYNGAVYAAGAEVIGGSNFATVWKDGAVLYTATETSSYANSVVVEGNYVFMAGASSSTGKVWKNGVAQSGYANAKEVYSLCISGSDIYAAGYTTDQKAVVWKNGTQHYTFAAGTSNRACSVAIDENGDIYTVGYGSNGTLWYPGVYKNNALLYLLGTAGTTDPSRLGLHISDSNIYVAGHEIVSGNSVACLWKNGVQQPLDISGLTSTYAYSVFVFDGDVYVAGRSADKSILWKNDEAPTTLASSSVAYSVFVAPPDGVGIVEKDHDPSLQVYPNPTRGELRITNYELRMNNVEIYDVYGRKHEGAKAQKSEIGQPEIEINLSHLPTGIYFLRVDGQTVKVIKN